MKSKKAKEAKETKKQSAKDTRQSPSPNQKKKSVPVRISTSLLEKKVKFPLPPQPKNFKQIQYNPDTNKLFLLDYNNNSYECSFLGERKTKYKNNLSGTTTFNERLKQNKINPLNFNPEKNIYAPAKFMEGYTNFPRPLSIPFVNEVKNEKKLNNLVKELKKEQRFITEKNKKQINLSIPSKDYNCLLSYMTSSLNPNEQNTKKNLIEMADNYIKDLQENEYKFKKNEVFKRDDVKALLKFKQVLLENTADCINGKKLKLPTEETKNTYSLVKYNINQCISCRGRENQDKHINEKIYKDIYSVSRVPNNYILGKRKSVIKDDVKNKSELHINKSPNVYNKEMCNSNGRPLSSRTKFDYESPNSYTPSNVKYSSNVNSIGNNINSSSGGEDIFDKNYPNLKLLNKNFTTPKRNIRTASTGFNVSNSNFFSKKENFSFDRRKIEDNLIYLDDIEVPEAKQIILPGLKGKNKFINGFVTDRMSQKNKDLFKRNIGSIKGFEQNALKDLEILEKTNPIAFKKEKEKMLFDKKELEKKRKNRETYERIKIKS